MLTIEQNKVQVTRDIQLKRSLLNKKPKISLKRVHKWQYPHRVDLFYRNQLDKIVDIISAATHNIIIPQLPRLLREATANKPTSKLDSVINDDYIDDVAAIINQFRIYINNKQTDPKLLAQTIGLDTSQFNRDQFNKVMKSAFGVNLLTTEPWLSGHIGLFVEQNVDLIKDLSDKVSKDFRSIILRGFSSGSNLKTITSNLLSRMPMTRNRAKLIARDQVSKLNGQLTELRQTQNGISKYQWVTAGDERVRPSHAEKEGNIYEWNKPPLDTGNPGEDINCRCVALPVLDDLI